MTAEPSRRADRRRNDEAIASAAARLFAQEVAPSMQSVADAAGVTRATVYRRFPNREALELAVREYAVASVERALDDFAGWSAGRTSFRDLLDALLEVGRAYPIALRRHRISPTPGPVDERMIGLLHEGQRAGVLRDDVPATYLNAAVLALLGAACEVSHLETEPARDVVVDVVLGAVTAPVR